MTSPSAKRYAPCPACGLPLGKSPLGWALHGRGASECITSGRGDVLPTWQAQWDTRWGDTEDMVHAKTGWEATCEQYKKLAETTIKGREQTGQRHVLVLAEDLLYLLEQAELSRLAEKQVP